MGGPAGRSLLGEQAGMAQKGTVQGLGAKELWPALDCREVGEPWHNQPLAAAADAGGSETALENRGRIIKPW